MFQETKQSGAGKCENEVHYHSNGECLKVGVVSACHAFCGVEKLYDSDDGKYTGIFDVNDQVVADLRHNISQSLWKDYVYHGLHMGHSNGLSSLGLAFVNGKNSAADSFCHVGSGVDGHYEKCGKPHGHVNVKQVGTSIVNEHGLNHHRGSAEKFHVAGHDKFQDSYQDFLGL